MKRILITFFFVFFSFGSAIATDYQVNANNGSNTTGDGSQTKPWMTISYALSQISGTGHTINVAPGTYDTVMDGTWFEVFPLMMKNGISLIGSGADSTILDAKETASVIKCENIDALTKIEGLTIKNGKGDFDTEGGGIHLYYSSPMIKNNIFLKNEGEWIDGGGGIHCEYSNPTIINNIFRENDGDGGGAMTFIGATNILVKGNVIDKNKGSHIIFCNYTQNLIIDNNQFINNESTWDLIDFESGNATLCNNIIILNNPHSQAIINCDGSSLIIERNIIANNQAKRVFWCYQFWNYEYIRYLRIQFNTITNNTGDVLKIEINHRENITNFIITNNIISNNSGYGILEDGTNDDPQIVSYNLFYNNSKGHYYNENSQTYTTVTMMDAMIPECSNNLEGDPLFVDEPNMDYHLLLGSPAIDAGDPNSPLDPDGTRADIGAYYLFDATLPPIAPRNVQSIAGNSQVTLIWYANLEPDFSHYVIYRSQSSGFTPTPNDSIARVENPDTTYIDSNVTNNVTYYYRLCAVDLSGIKSDYSSEVSAKPHVQETVHYYVNDSGANDPSRGTQSNPWKTITYALSQISLANVDFVELHVSSGTYTRSLGELFPIQVRNKISLIGENSATTILDAGGSASVLKCVGVSDAATQIKGFTIRNGSNSEGGGGIFVTAGSCPEITKNVIINNKVPFSQMSTSPESRLGGGIYVLNSSAKIIDNQITSNWAGATSITSTGSGGWGGGIAVSGSASNVIIKDNTITNNRAINTSFASAYGGGIYIGGRASAEIIGNTIIGNSLRQLSATSGNTRGGGIYISSSNGTIISTNVISNNTVSAMYGSVSGCSGIFIKSSNLTLTNNIFAKNDYNGVAISGSSPQVINNTIAYNKQDGIYLSNSSSPTVINNILAFNSNYGLRESSYNDDPSPVSYNLFYYNESGLYFDEGNNAYYSISDLNNNVQQCSDNIDGDPLFVNASTGDYHLRSGSPCIDAGHPDVQYNDPDGSRNDIGAYGGPGVFTSVKELPNKENGIPEHYYLSQNYPNPFNPETTIRYYLPKSSEVTLKIYNLNGQLVKTLVNTKLATGYFSVMWDGKDDYGTNVSSGVYLYSLRIKDFSQMRKMILVR